jgi:hypothetical protein
MILMAWGLGRVLHRLSNGMKNERKVNQTPVDRWTTEKRRPWKTLSVLPPSVFLVETTQLVNKGNDFTR